MWAVPVRPCARHFSRAGEYDSRLNAPQLASTGPANCSSALSLDLAIIPIDQLLLSFSTKVVAVVECSHIYRSASSTLFCPIRLPRLSSPSLDIYIDFKN